MMSHGQIQQFVDTATKKPSSKFTKWFLVGTSLVAFQYIWWKAPDGSTHVARYEVSRPADAPFEYSNLDRKILALNVFLTTAGSNQTWTVPADWNNGDNDVSCVGGGGSGGGLANLSGGGAGGAFTRLSNLTLTPGASVTYRVGSGGPAQTSNAPGTAGGDTWFNDTAYPTTGSNKVGAKGGDGGCGSAGTPTAQGGAAASGYPSSGTGLIRNSGGNAAAAANNGSNSGGGAAGPNGNGNNGVTGTGGSGDAGSGGAGGVSGSINGKAGTEFDGSKGSGGGGRGDDNSQGAGTGGLYGGGGGEFRDSGLGSSAGAQGLIWIRYTPFVFVSGSSTEVPAYIAKAQMIGYDC